MSEYTYSRKDVNEIIGSELGTTAAKAAKIVDGLILDTTFNTTQKTFTIDQIDVLTDHLRKVAAKPAIWFGYYNGLKTINLDYYLS